MTTQQFEALLIDQSFGELPEEVDALLETLLAQREDLRESAVAIREALRITGEVVAERPGLFRTEPPVPDRASTAPVRFPRFFTGGLKIAAVCMALALAAGAGYRSGRNSPEAALPTVAEKAPSTDSPWARYRVEADGRLAVVSTTAPGS